MIRHSILILCAFALVGLHPVAAQTVTLEPDSDTTIFEESADPAEIPLSNGVGQRLFIGQRYGNLSRRALLHFDLSNIPPTATIGTVLLSLSMTKTIGSTYPATVHALDGGWGEAGSDAPAQEGKGAAALDGDATWTHRVHPTIPWNTLGGDFGPAVASADVGGNGRYTWGNNPDITALIQSWVDDPSTNFGLIIIGNEGDTGQPTAKRFDSRERPLPPALQADRELGAAAGFAGTRPELTITYGGLPVELVDFSSRVVEDQVVLTWETGSEWNNDGFEVQHVAIQADRSDEWSVLDFVQGAGSTETSKSYSYEVSGLHPGLHRFRLKQIDSDGAFEYSDAIEATISVDGTHALAAIYPNPVTSRGTVTLTVGQDQTVRASLYDVVGREVLSVFDGRMKPDVAQSLNFDASSLAAGTYVFRAEGESFVVSRMISVIN